MLLNISFKIVHLCFHTSCEMLPDYGVKTRKLRRSVAKTLARFSACLVSWTSCPSVARTSWNTATTSCTFSTRFLVCSGEDVCMAILLLRSTNLLRSEMQLDRCVWNSLDSVLDVFAELLLLTNNLDAVTSFLTSMVRVSFAS